MTIQFFVILPSINQQIITLAIDKR